MLFKMPKGDERILTIAEALKLGSDEFDTSAEAQTFVEDKGIKAKYVDAKGVPHYSDSDLGVFQPEDDNKKDKKDG